MHKNRGFLNFCMHLLSSINRGKVKESEQIHVQERNLMEVLCIGQAVYDLSLPCGEEIAENRKYILQSHMECMGGPAANSAYLCGIWGASTALVARIGQDMHGKLIMRTLKEAQVDTEMILQEQIPTSLSCVLVNPNNGHRTIWNHPMDSVTPLQLHTASIPTVILCDGHELDASLLALEQFPQAISVLDAGTYHPACLPLIQAVDYLVCSHDFVYQFCGKRCDRKHVETIYEIMQQLHTLNHKHIVITLGEQGCLYEDASNIVHLPAFPVESVDTTGAGDVFHGAFAYAMAKHVSLSHALQFSSLAAAISTQSFGGQPSIPTLAQVNAQYDAYKQKNLLPKQEVLSL